MDGQRCFYEMENPAENPSKAAEYLTELNKIIETQLGLLEKQRLRIDELELQVTELCAENACLKEQHQRHLAACRLHQGGPSALGAIAENVVQENCPVDLESDPKVDSAISTDVREADKWCELVLKRRASKDNEEPWR